MQSDQSQFIGLLDHIYEAAEDPAAFDDMVRAAETLFLAEEVVTSEPPVIDEALLRHTARVQRIIDMRAEETGVSAPDATQEVLKSMRESAFARLILARGGVILTGNDAAAAALGIDGFPTALSRATLDHAGIRALEAALRDIQLGSTSVLPVGVGADEKRCLAMTTPMMLDANAVSGGTGFAGGMVLSVSLSYIEWTDALFEAVADTMDLSRREGQVLLGLLQGQTQAQIATSQNRSTETIKAQAKAILRKSSCAQIADVVMLANSIAYLSRTAADDVSVEPGGDGIIAAPEQSHYHEHIIDGPDGRKIGYLTCGAEQGFPVFFSHAQLQGPYLTATMAAGLATAGFTLYAVSRPGYGGTSDVAEGGDFVATLQRDADHVATALGLDRLLLLSQHGGTLASCHLADQFEGRARGLLLVNGMLPTANKRRFSNTQSQLFRAAVSRAPAIGEMLLRVHLSTYRRQGGVETYWRKFFAGQSRDLDALADPEIIDVLKSSGDHVFAGDPRAMIRDASIILTDWRPVLQGIPCRVSVLYGELCSTISKQAMTEWATQYANHPVKEVNGAGSLLMHTHWEAVVAELTEMRNW